MHFADGMCTPFRVSISLLFFNIGYRIRAYFKPVAKGEIFARVGVLFTFWSILFANYF